MANRNTIIETINRYYEAVDAKDLDSLFSLFHEKIVYVRGQQHIEGMEAFKGFYNETRPISDGKHVIDQTYIEPPESCVRGHFVGVLKDGTKVKIDFADFFLFEDEQIIWRKTYFRGLEV